jgi:hypothetical protein
VQLRCLRRAFDALCTSLAADKDREAVEQILNSVRASERAIGAERAAQAVRAAIFELHDMEKRED